MRFVRNDFEIPQNLLAVKRRALCSIESRSDGEGRGSIVPVRATDVHELASDVGTLETQVVRRQRTIVIDERAKVRRDAGVEADMAVGTMDAAEIARERLEARDELFPDYSLSLDFADLLSDNPLCELLEDNETLLDDLDLFGMANNDLLLNEDLAVVEATEVVGSKEIIKVGERATEVVEATVTTEVIESTSGKRCRREWGGDCTWGSDGKKSGDGKEGFGEHVYLLEK